MHLTCNHLQTHTDIGQLITKCCFWILSCILPIRHLESLVKVLYLSSALQISSTRKAYCYSRALTQLSKGLQEFPALIYLYPLGFVETS